jgi:filamentous hemagglutinin
LAKLTQYGLTVSELKTALKTAAQAYKGATKAEHGLSKHAGRPGGEVIWGKITGASKTWHNQAMKHVREIFRETGQFQSVTDPSTGLSWIEKRLPDGRGIRLNLDHTFKGFID